MDLEAAMIKTLDESHRQPWLKPGKKGLGIILAKVAWYIKNMCAFLVVVRESKSFFRLIHQSVCILISERVWWEKQEYISQRICKGT
jgi:hypothetical protein